MESETLKEVIKNNSTVTIEKNGKIFNFITDEFKYSNTESQNNIEGYSKILADENGDVIYSYEHNLEHNGETAVSYNYEHVEIMKNLLEKGYLKEEELISYTEIDPYNYEQAINYNETNRRREFLGLEPVKVPIMELYENASQLILGDIIINGYFIDENISIKDLYYDSPTIKNLIEDDDLSFDEYTSQKISENFKKYSTDFSHMNALLGKTVNPNGEYGIIYLDDYNYNRFSCYEEAYCKLGMEDGWLSEKEKADYKEAFPEFFKENKKQEIKNQNSFSR